MKYLAVLFIFAAPSLVCTQALACSDFAGGISTADLQASIKSIEAKLRDEKKFSTYKDVKFLWESVVGGSGMEGDCDAITVDATVNVSMKSKDSNFCATSVEVTYRDSSEDIYKMFKAEIDDVHCF